MAGFGPVWGGDVIQLAWETTFQPMNDRAPGGMCKTFAVAGCRWVRLIQFSPWCM